MPRGGARPGAGRKAKLTKFGGQIALAEQKIADQLPWVVGKAFELAAGMKDSVPLIDKVTGKPMMEPMLDPATGEPMLDPVTGDPMLRPMTELIYVKLPNIKAIQFLYERIAGKPPQEVILSGEDGGPIEINATHRQQATIELEQWRAEMTGRLQSLPSVPPISPTSAIPTESSMTPRE